MSCEWTQGSIERVEESLRSIEANLTRNFYNIERLLFIIARCQVRKTQRESNAPWNDSLCWDLESLLAEARAAYEADT